MAAFDQTILLGQDTAQSINYVYLQAFAAYHKGFTKPDKSCMNDKTTPLTSLISHSFDSYRLIDSGEGLKLESYGPYRIIRPEPQCFWPKRDKSLWEDVDAIFDPSGYEDEGRWRLSRQVSERFELTYKDISFYGRLTAFRHLGFFPEQSANWHWQGSALEKAILKTPNLHLLNLFGYTGVASLNAAALGVKVTHVDASKKAIGWARENATLSGLEDAPIRWICEDARKYVKRELKRDTKYDAIILDPPKYGRGPDGQIWKLFEDISELLDDCVRLLSDRPVFLLINAYAARISASGLDALLSDTLKRLRPDLSCSNIQAGELCLEEHALTDQPQRQRRIGLSFFARFIEPSL